MDMNQQHTVTFNFSSFDKKVNDEETDKFVSYLTNKVYDYILFLSKFYDTVINSVKFIKSKAYKINQGPFYVMPLIFDSLKAFDVSKDEFIKNNLNSPDKSLIKTKSEKFFMSNQDSDLISTLEMALKCTSDEEITGHINFLHHHARVLQDKLDDIVDSNLRDNLIQYFYMKMIG